jgi:hypothetical protein
VRKIWQLLVVAVVGVSLGLALVGCGSPGTGNDKMGDKMGDDKKDKMGDKMGDRMGDKMGEKKDDKMGEKK